MGAALPAMSWRRFLVLAGNLSPEGAVAARLRKEGREGTEERSAASGFFTALSSLEARG